MSKPIASLIRVEAPSSQETNEQWYRVLDVILNNRTLVSQLQFSIAVTAHEYRFPAERVSAKQAAHLEKAMALLVDARVLTESDIPKKTKKAA